MKEFLPIILGTDHNSYTVARIIHETYGIKSAVVGSAILVPFYKSKIADFYIQQGFSTNDKIFVETLNEVYKKNSDYDNYIVFVPTEEYLNTLYRNCDSLDFDLIIPYPNRKLASTIMIKENAYRLLEQLSVKYPKTQIVNRDNYSNLSLDGELFLKASDYELFNDYEFKNKKKGYYCKDKNEAISYLKDIYSSDFNGEMVVQTYIPGGDGSEYTINGYRSKNGVFSIGQARNVLSDHRDMWIGNHIVQSDSHIEQLFEIGKKVITGLDYYGLFNMDFKMNEKTGEIYVFEINTRQGRTFLYSYLGGVNVIKAAIDDRVFNIDDEFYPTKKFNLIMQSKEAVEENLKGELKEYFEDPERLNNTHNPIVYEKDMSIARKIKIDMYLKRSDKDVFRK
ncbi:MAG: ATP-grasp domain-containing protein [Tissierellia bacterium]|nr:ATP-grasp domain-containing protein [Tissierellia bacterium]